MSPRHQQVLRFLVVGIAAAAVHLGVVLLLVRTGNWPPLMANLVGWLAAFGLSFSGHQQWTFRGSHVATAVSIRRFFLLSAAGFAVNELAYAAALRWSGFSFDSILFCVLLLVAFGTYVASRLWAFKGSSLAVRR